MYTYNTSSPNAEAEGLHEFRANLGELERPYLRKPKQINEQKLTQREQRNVCRWSVSVPENIMAVPLLHKNQLKVSKGLGRWLKGYEGLLCKLVDMRSNLQYPHKSIYGSCAYNYIIDG